MRDQTFDVAKGFAALCIILGHAAIPGVVAVVFPFHVPIFFFISGYFLKSSRTLREAAQRGFHHLIVPYLVTCLAMCILSIISDVFMEQVGIQREIKQNLLNWSLAAVYGAGFTPEFPAMPMIGAIWFLWSLFWGQLLVLWTLHDLKKRLFAYILVIWLLYFSARWIWLPCSIQTAGTSSLYILAGYGLRQFMKQNQIKSLQSFFNPWLLAVALGVWFMAARTFTAFWLVSNNVGDGLLDLIESLIVIYVVMALSGLCVHYFGPGRQVLSWIGRHSLAILCIHILEQNLFPWHLVQQFLSLGPTLSAWVIGMLKILLVLLAAFLFVQLRQIWQQQAEQKI